MPIVESQLIKRARRVGGKGRKSKCDFEIQSRKEVKDKMVRYLSEMQGLDHKRKSLLILPVNCNQVWNNLIQIIRFQ